MTVLLTYRHAKVQRLRRLIGRRSAREAERAFVVEGATLLGEAVRAGAPIESVYVAARGARAPERSSAVTAAWEAGARVYDLEPGVVERVAGTVTPQPVLAVVAMGATTVEALSGPRPVVVCIDVRDPGNLGSVLRSAEAAGAAGVVCCDGTVDVFNPKCVRASAGAVFHIPIVAGGEVVSVLEALGRGGWSRLATAPTRGIAYSDADLAGSVAFILGNEANGLPDGLESALDGIVHVPMEGRSESLNVGMAAAVLCFEAARQRRVMIAGRSTLRSAAGGASGVTAGGGSGVTLGCASGVGAGADRD